jgi:hypothetical protein
MRFNSSLLSWAREGDAKKHASTGAHKTRYANFTQTSFTSLSIGLLADASVEAGRRSAGGTVGEQDFVSYFGVCRTPDPHYRQVWREAVRIRCLKEGQRSRVA